MKKLILIFTIFFSLTSINAQEIENGKYSFRNGERARIVEITNDTIRVTRRNSYLEEYTITEKREIDGVKQIICDISKGQKIVITQKMNGKGLFMYKWDNNNKKPTENLKYWYVKYHSSHKLKKINLTQTKRNW